MRMLWSNVNLRGRLMFWRRRPTTDFSDEIRAHIALEADRLVAEGMHPDQAARVARQRFGDTTAATERFYESRRRLWLDELHQDFRAAWRNLVRYPVVAIVAVLSLGAGIGATAASLTIRDAFFQNPPPLYQQPEQLSKVQVQAQDRPFRPIGGRRDEFDGRRLPALATREPRVRCEPAHGGARGEPLWDLDCAHDGPGAADTWGDGRFCRNGGPVGRLHERK
jgi:hypothetical protein